jgi:membrane protease YdiL (CAAX protease family)
LKKGIIAFFHSLLYPLIYFVSQIFALFAAIFIYTITESIESGARTGDIPADAFALQNNFLPVYNQQIIIAACIMTCLVILLILKTGKRRLRDAFVIRRLPVLKAVMIVLLGVSINISTMYILALLPIPENVLKQYEEMVGNVIMSDNIWLTILTAALFVPVTEEIVFRGMSFNILRRSMSVTLAVVLQTIIFAGSHILPLQISYVLPTALVLGLVYVWCGSFLAPVLLHISYNGFSSVFSAISEAAAEGAVAESVQFEYIDFIVLAVSLAVTVACLIALYVTRERDAGLEKA